MGAWTLKGGQRASLKSPHLTPVWPILFWLFHSTSVLCSSALVTPRWLQWGSGLPWLRCIRTGYYKIGLYITSLWPWVPHQTCVCWSPSCLRLCYLFNSMIFSANSLQLVWCVFWFLVASLCYELNQSASSLAILYTAGISCSLLLWYLAVLLPNNIKFY